MTMKPDQISITITNHLPQVMTVPVMAGISMNELDCFAKDVYEWDLATETFIGLTSLTLFYKLVGAASFVPMTTAFTGSNIAELLRVLNGLGLGLFSANGTTVYSYDRNYVFDDLELS